MSEMSFTRSHLADYRRWLGIGEESRDRLLKTYPTREAAIEAMEYGKPLEQADAIRVLGGLGDLDTVLHYALVERENGWVPLIACELLAQPPLDILIQWLTRMKARGDGSRLSEVVGTVLRTISFAHVADGLADFLARHKRMLKTLLPDYLKRLGASGLVPLGKLLQPFMRLETLRTYAQALEAGVPRSRCRPSWQGFMDGSESLILDRDSASGVAAAVALRRLDQPVDTARVADWLQQLERLFSAEIRARFPVSDFVMDLRWVLFDAGDDSQLPVLLSPQATRLRPDLAMTLLMRGDHANFERWLQSTPERFPELVHPPGEVRFWPLIDHLQSLGIQSAGNRHHYLLARAAEVPPPPGWTWRCMPADT